MAGPFYEFIKEAFSFKDFLKNVSPKELSESAGRGAGAEIYNRSGIEKHKKDIAGLGLGALAGRALARRGSLGALAGLAAARHKDIGEAAKKGYKKIKKTAGAKRGIASHILAALGGGAAYSAYKSRGKGPRTKKGGGGYVDNPKIPGLISESAEHGTPKKAVKSLKDMMKG